jgi:uncharacterized protein (UPF0218 family)
VLVKQVNKDVIYVGDVNTRDSMSSFIHFSLQVVQKKQKITKSQKNKKIKKSLALH